MPLVNFFFENVEQNDPHCRASGGMAIFLGVSAAPERILLSKISYAPVQHSFLHQKVLLCLIMKTSFPALVGNSTKTMSVYCV